MPPQPNLTKSILFVHDYPLQGGGGLVVNTNDMTASFVKAGWQVSLASPELKTDAMLNGIHPIRITDLNQLRTVVENHQIIIVNLNFSMRPGAVGTIQVCRVLRKPYYIWFRTTLKNLFFYRYANQARFEQETRLEELKTLLSDSLCIKVICVSQSVLVDLTRLGVLAEKLCVIRDGVGIKGRGVFEKSSSLRGEKGDLVFVGRLSLEKGPRYLIDAVKILKERFPKIRVSIIGQGPEENYLKTMVKVLGLEKNITFYGHLPNGELLESVKRYKAYCNSSLTESFGISIVEAMLCGVPVIAPKIEGPKEVLANGRFGMLFELGNTKDLADKIAFVLANPREASKIARKARVYAQNEFSLDRQFGKFEKLINNKLILTNNTFSDLVSLSRFEA